MNGAPHILINLDQPVENIAMEIGEIKIEKGEIRDDMKTLNKEIKEDGVQAMKLQRSEPSQETNAPMKGDIEITIVKPLWQLQEPTPVLAHILQDLQKLEKIQEPIVVQKAQDTSQRGQDRRDEKAEKDVERDNEQEENYESLNERLGSESDQENEAKLSTWSVKYETKRVTRSQRKTAEVGRSNNPTILKNDTERNITNRA